MGLVPGDIVEGKYRIVRLLGEGGMGAVYEGENVRIRHRVAIKVLHAAVAAAPQVVERFEREAQAAGQIGSEHIVEVLDLGHLPNGERFMVMEFLDGQNLAQRLHAKGRLTPADLLPVTLQMLDGLGAAHNAGIVHRDLKPENVFLLRSRGGTRDFVKIVDFGISKFTQGDAEGRSSATRTGSVMGTPAYMSPEQAKGSRDIDSRTDLYAVGVILYEALTGGPPFVGETFNEVLFKVVLEPHKPILELFSDIDPNFVAIVDKAMAKTREQRFQHAAEFQQALIEWATAAGVRMLAAGSGSFTDGRVSVPYGAAGSPSGAYSSLSTSGSQVVRAKTPVGFTPARGALPSDALGPGRPSDAPAGGRPATVGSWATSGVDGSKSPPAFGKRKHAGIFLLAAGALFGLSALAGGAIWFVLRSRTPSAAPDVPATSPAASSEQKTPEATPAPAATVNPAPTVSPATEPPEMPAASSSARVPSSGLAQKAKRAPPEGRPPPTTASASPLEGRRPQTTAKAPAAKSAPPATGSAKAGTAAKPPTVSGRKIYTEL